MDVPVIHSDCVIRGKTLEKSLVNKLHDLAKNTMEYYGYVVPEALVPKSQQLEVSEEEETQQFKL